MDKFKMATMAILLSSLYELKVAEHFGPELLRAVIFIVGSGLVAEVSSRLVTGSRWLRRQYFGQSWVEGVWYLETLEGKEGPAAHGIAIIQYVGDDLHPEIDIEKHDPATGKPTVTKSELAVVHDSYFINKFTYKIDETFRKGFAIGDFRSDGKQFPTYYDGVWVIFDDHIFRRQIGFKLNEKSVGMYRKKYGREWKNEVFKVRGKGLEA